MESFNLFYKLVDELERKIPHKSVLVNSLADLLCIEKESVYRRLRKEIPFTLAEAGLIARKFDISMDELLYGISHNTKRYLWESQEQYYLFDSKRLSQYNNFLDEVGNEDYNESGFIINSFDPFFFSRRDFLTRFILFKWLHKFNKDVSTHFEDLKPDSDYLKLKNQTVTMLNRIKSRCYVLDPNFLSNFINDIHYFESTHLIEKSSIENIKAELYIVLNALEESAGSGQFMQTNSQFELYIANISIGQSCSYVGSLNNYLSVLISFELLTCSSRRKKNYEAVKNWFKRVKGLSTQISVSADKERTLFFKAQRAMVEKL